MRGTYPSDLAEEEQGRVYACLLGFRVLAMRGGGNIWTNCVALLRTLFLFLLDGRGR